MLTRFERWSFGRSGHENAGWIYHWRARQIIYSLTEQLSRSFSQSLQLRGIYDV
jgi:hypothetical protein